MGREPSVIEVVLLGEELSEDIVDNARSQLAAYDLNNTKLIVTQTTWSGDTQVNLASVQQSYSELLVERNKDISRLRNHLSVRDSLINHLTTRLSEYEGRKIDTLASASMAKESFTISESIEEISLARHITYNSVGHKTDTVLVCLVKTDSLSISERERMTRWLQVRSDNQNVMIYVQE